jgi:carboxylesterase type B
MLMFRYGDEIAENGAANLGLKDQLKALEWVKQNIWAWGGDPDRVCSISLSICSLTDIQVTVTGESAGAISIALMYLQQDIDLFRGAVRLPIDTTIKLMADYAIWCSFHCAYRTH